MFGTLALRGPSRREVGAQVLGTPVVSYRRYPYKAREILYLYKELLRVVYRYPPLERPDLLFRLRNEFSSKRHLAGPRVISAALKRGHGILDVQRALLDGKEVRQKGLAGKGRGARSVDGAWDQIQLLSGNMIPGLKNFGPSKQMARQERYGVSGGMNHSVYSRRLRHR